MTPPQKLNAAPPVAASQNVKRSGTVARPQTAEERRRAQRVLLRMAVLIHVPGKANPLHGVTHTVSASGAMIILPEGISHGHQAFHRKSQDPEKSGSARRAPAATQRRRLPRAHRVHHAFSAVLEHLLPTRRPELTRSKSWHFHEQRRSSVLSFFAHPTRMLKESQVQRHAHIPSRSGLEAKKRRPAFAERLVVKWFS